MWHGGEEFRTNSTADAATEDAASAGWSGSEPTGPYREIEVMDEGLGRIDEADQASASKNIERRVAPNTRQDLNPNPKLKSEKSLSIVPPAQSQQATEGAWTLARRRWQEGTVYVRKNKKLPDAWWGRYVETVETETGVQKIQRNVLLGEARVFTKPLAKRALRDYVDKVNNYQPVAVKSQMMGKASTPFSVFAQRWQDEVLIHKKASTTATVKGHINNLLIPAFGKLAVGDVDSERVQSFLNRLVSKVAPKTVKNVWTTLRIMRNSAVAWKYVTGELRVELPKGRKLRQRCYTVEQVKIVLAYTEEENRAFFWLAAEVGLRVGELKALHVSDVDVENLSVEVSKAIWNGSEDNPKTEAGFRSICISAKLGDQLKHYLDGRQEGFLFQTSTGKPRDASNVLERKLNTLLERLGIPKIDTKLLAKIVGKDRTVEQATRSEKRAASVGLHSFRHTNATAMDSLGIPQQIRKQRLGHSGNTVTENYTHTFTQDERDAAEKLGEFFGTGWPETGQGKVISFPKRRRASYWRFGSPCESVRLVAGVRFELTTFGL
jgi:integrase